MPPPPTPPTFHIVGDAFVDLFSYVNGAWPKEPGRDSRLSLPIRPVPGGSAVNTSTHLQSLCSDESNQDSDRPDVVLFTVLNPSDDYGKILLRHAKEHGLDLVNCHGNHDDDEAAASTAHCVVIVTGEERSFLSYHGCVETFSASALPSEQMVLTNGPLHLHIAGFFNLRGFWNGDLRDQLWHIRQERKKRFPAHMTTISLVTQFDGTDQWDGGIDELVPCLDFLIMNEVEASNVFCRRQDAGQAGQFSENPKTYMVVTRGARGAMAFQNSQQVASQSSVSNVDVVDTTGAGDAFAAGFLHGIWDWRQQHDDEGREQDWPLAAVEHGLRWGCTAGTASVTIRGASTPSKTADIQALLEQIAAAD